MTSSHEQLRRQKVKGDEVDDVDLEGSYEEGFDQDVEAQVEFWELGLVLNGLQAYQHFLQKLFIYAKDALTKKTKRKEAMVMANVRVQSKMEYNNKHLAQVEEKNSHDNA